MALLWLTAPLVATDGYSAAGAAELANDADADPDRFFLFSSSNDKAIALAKSSSSFFWIAAGSAGLAAVDDSGPAADEVGVLPVVTGP